jgi:hypothetical protein
MAFTVPCAVLEFSPAPFTFRARRPNAKREQARGEFQTNSGGAGSVVSGGASGTATSGADGSPGCVGVAPTGGEPGTDGVSGGGGGACGPLAGGGSGAVDVGMSIGPTNGTP